MLDGCVVAYSATASGSGAASSMQGRMKTYSARPADIAQRWIVVDADGLVLGRAASVVATRLRGKHRPQYTPHIDCGDHVVVVNAEKVRLTGNKRAAKTYYRHTGYPGGIRSMTAEAVLNGAHPDRVFVKAVERMIPRTPLGRAQMRKLRVYAGPDHPHAAQKPARLDVAALNPKNVPRR